MESGESCYRLFLEGDKAAFAQLVETYRPGLIRFVNAYVHNVHTAEDIAIDCFASLLVHPRRYRFSVPFKSYLYMLGRSRAVDWLRRQRRAQTVPPEEAEAELVSLDTPQQAAEDAGRFGHAAAAHKRREVGGEEPVVDSQLVRLDPGGELGCGEAGVAPVGRPVNQEALAGGGSKGVNDIELPIRETLGKDFGSVSG